MNNLIYIQSDGDQINNNSLESLAAMQKFSKSNNENLYAVTFNKSVADQLNEFEIDKIIFVNNQ